MRTVLDILIIAALVFVCIAVLTVITGSNRIEAPEYIPLPDPNETAEEMDELWFETAEARYQLEQAVVEVKK